LALFVSNLYGSGFDPISGMRGGNVGALAASEMANPLGSGNFGGRE